QAKEDLFTVQNSRKARLGGLGGLRDESFLKRKTRSESELRSRIQAEGKPHDERVAAWDRIAAAQKTAARIAKPYSYLERGWAFDSALFKLARDLVRLAKEKTKPNS